MKQKLRGTVMRRYACATEAGTDVIEIGADNTSSLEGGEIVDLSWEDGRCEHCETWQRVIPPLHENVHVVDLPLRYCGSCGKWL